MQKESLNLCCRRKLKWAVMVMVCFVLTFWAQKSSYILRCFVGRQCCFALFPWPWLKSAVSGVLREEKDREKDGAARPSACVNKRQILLAMRILQLL